MSRLAVLGSTGSIGTQTLAVAEEFSDGLEVTALAARRDSDALFEQVRRFRPRVCCLVDAEAADRLACRLRAEGMGTEVLSGPGGLVALATASDVDTVVVSVAGNAALESSCRPRRPKAPGHRDKGSVGRRAPRDARSGTHGRRGAPGG